MAVALDSRDSELRELIDLIERSRSGVRDAPSLVASVASAMSSFTNGGATLPERYCMPCADRYAQHLIHVSPDRGFSLVALVWQPGQRTPVHDHRGWCVVSVAQGCERETRYRLNGDGGGAKLETVGARETGPGESVALLPDGSDLHCVVNCARATTISLHAYGVDIERYGTSVNRNFGVLAASGAF